MYKKDDAVSPVIGVILMVAITVILAAVIAAFVFGMAGNVQKTKNVAVVADSPTTQEIIVTYHGGQDANEVDDIIVTWLDDTTSTSSLGSTVGNSVTYGGTASAGKDHVVAVAKFKDGSSQVVLDTYV